MQGAVTTPRSAVVLPDSQLELTLSRKSWEPQPGRELNTR